MSAKDWILAAGAAGAVGGLVWYVGRSRRKRSAEEQFAAQVVKAMAMVDKAPADGNDAAGALVKRADAGALPFQGDGVKEAELRARMAEALALANKAIGDGNASASVAAPAQPSAPSASSAPPAAPSSSVTPTLLPLVPPPRLSQEFDGLFAKHGAGIPVPYLRALAQAESGMNPHDVMGLINVTSIARLDYNLRNRTSITREQMRDPAVNIRVAADILRVIIRSYEANHGTVRHFREKWDDRAFVELLTFGWNAGHSQSTGVGRVVRYVRRLPVGIRPTEITADVIFRFARLAGASPHLSNARKLAYSKGVAATYFRELAGSSTAARA